MSEILNPKNSVAQIFYLRAGIHPAHAPEPPVKEVTWKPEQPNAAAQFVNKKGTLIEKWFQS
jgi:hypothetical protein